MAALLLLALCCCLSLRLATCSQGCAERRYLLLASQSEKAHELAANDLCVPHHDQGTSGPQIGDRALIMLGVLLRSEDRSHTSPPCSVAIPSIQSETQSQNFPQIFSHLGPSQHSLRPLRETSLGKTLAAVGPTRAGLLPLRFSTPGAHGLAADLATGGPTGPPGIKITHVADADQG